jgi:hypothetical protein
VDFGLIYLRQIYREGLQANNVVPFGPPQWFTREGPVGGHYVVGFPEEFTETASLQGRIIGARVKPVMIPLHEVPDDSPHPFTRFKARVIDKGNQESVVGMSGGPIIAYYPDGDDARYRLVAIQSKATQDETAVYGCPVHKFLELASESLQEGEDSE